ncbi:MAG TPA: MFS transporter, partial [Rhizomicrobium sp.]|nr:MFS transporter [Rhizomicrobium sp.]
MGEGAFSRAAWRLIPFMGLLYVVNYLDRVNVSFAALTMNRDLGLSSAAYGFGAGIFFLGYFLFEVPSNAILMRVGARRWIFRIMISWGAVSMTMAFARTAPTFYALRFLQGVSEAGFFPGMILYLTFWFPAATRARFNALFLGSIVVANIVGSPLSGAILGLHGLWGLHGWQWLFLIEGLPACALASAVLKFLPDGPAQATFLSAAEKQTIATRLAAERPAAPKSPWPGLYDPQVLLLGLAGTGINAAIFGNQLWLPQIVKSLGYSNLTTGFIVSLPYMLGIPIMLLVARSSDRRGERVWHTGIPLMVTAAGFTVAALAHNPFVVIAGLFAVVWGLVGTYGPYYSLAS